MAQRQYPPIFVDPSTNDEYRILQQLSLSISSAVFKAVGPQGDVALKAWFPGNLHLFGRDNKARKRFQHHGVLSIRAVFQHGEFLCQVLPLCAKQSVLDIARTKESEKFDEPEAQAILQQVAVVMSAMHQKGLVHCYLQSSNILLDDDDRPLSAKLSDNFRRFYIPSIDVSVDEMTIRYLGAADMLGNRRDNQTYMPPERLVTPHRFGKAADVWAFGILMFEMLVGRLPERNDETHEVQFGDDLEGLSQKAIKLIRSLLSPNPDNRLNFNEILQAPFIRSEEQDQGVQKRKKKKSQQDVSQVTDTAIQSQAEPTASVLAAPGQLTVEEFIAFLITPTGDLSHHAHFQNHVSTTSTTSTTSNNDSNDIWYKDATFSLSNTLNPQESMPIVLSLRLPQDELLLDPEI
ncbi:MAG: kinase-like domain-containing protein [Linnemannia gamsii]|nr:MAG: kinase-like domain-containing protein [Linnemannia gamsii]